MKITIIGCGNMGGAIVRGLVRSSILTAEDISAVDVNADTLAVLKSEIPALNVDSDPIASIPQADIIIIAVKPWLVDSVIDCIKYKMHYERQVLISIAAGIPIEELEKSLVKQSDQYRLPTIFRVIPNTAISIRKSVNLIATDNASEDQKNLILSIFNELGASVILDEDKLNAATAITSCGIAYLFRYIRAATLAGVEMGLYPRQAQTLAIDTMLGAAELLKTTGENPETEIDKVTTPAGITIRGLNELEANGFSSAIVKALKASKF